MIVRTITAVCWLLLLLVVRLPVGAMPLELLQVSVDDAPRGDSRPSALNGSKALFERAFVPVLWRTSGYDGAWKQWGLKESPQDYGKAFREQYGLHPAPFENGKYPMGMRETTLARVQGLTTDCLLCHGGSFMGKSYVGMPNSSLDIQSLFEDLNSATSLLPAAPITLGFVRGTTESGNLSVALLQNRNPDLSIRIRKLDLSIKERLIEDVPAWWLLKKKQTMYATGSADARSVRALMQFMLHPLNGKTFFETEEATFRDIQAYILSLEAPKYPKVTVAKLVDKGAGIFAKTCSKCHGTYGKDPTYPNLIVPARTIRTDTRRLEGISAKAAEHYNASWFGQEKRFDGKTGYAQVAAVGYQAPPLDGIWATAPYLHNGSVPTLEALLDSKQRPKIFTRSYKTGEADYDWEKVGWKVTVLEEGPASSASAREKRQIYDTSQPGCGNQGHTFGDDLSRDDRQALIEYLKTL
jgi:mono/diheme cytochrome c family protein